MKLRILSIFFLVLLTGNIFTEDHNTEDVTRIYYFTIISFHKVYYIYATFHPVGYYKYRAEALERTIYLTYEGLDFYNKSRFDENFTALEPFYPCNMWTNARGEVLRFREKHGPVIEENRERKNYPYGFGKN